MVENCLVAGNGGNGIYSFTTTNVTVANSTITGNLLGVGGSSGSVNPQTYGNNQLINNTTDGTMGTLITPK
jgi:hypothetical protein